jgi:hypothetical protein
MRLRRYQDAAVAARRLGRVWERAGISRNVVDSRMTLAMEEAGLPKARGCQLKRWLGCIRENPAGNYPMPVAEAVAEIRVAPDTLTEQVDAAEAALLEAGFGLYQRGGSIVRLGYVDGEGGREVLRETPVDETHLAELMGRAAKWTRYDARAKEVRPTGCPPAVAKTYLARGPAEWRLPRLAGIITAPTLRPDGSLLEYPCYDEATGLYHDRRDEEQPRIPDEPTMHDAAVAADELLGLIDGFPFVDDVDRAVAFSALLTAVVRPSLPAAPLHAFTAPAAGTGKSYLVDLVTTLATGSPAPGLTWTGDAAEDRKALDAALLAGSSIISLDNVSAPLGGDRLNQLLTQPVASVRVLGLSRNVEVACQALLLANGNNLAVAADMTRRTMLCRLDAGLERPELRTFEGDPLARVKAERGRYVAAALTILRGYIVAGRPEQPDPLGSFEAWSSLVRGALLWIWEADPVDSIEVVRAEDPVRSSQEAVMQQWDTLIGDQPVTTAEIITKAVGCPEFREALLTVAGAGGVINSVRLGKWLGAIRGKLVDGLKLEPATKSRGNARWTLRGGRSATEGWADALP